MCVCCGGALFCGTVAADQTSGEVLRGRKRNDAESSPSSSSREFPGSVALL